MLIAAVLAAATLAGGGIAQKNPTGLEIRTVRFWAPEGKVTYVLGLVDIPYALASPIGQGTAAFIAYDVTVRVLDDHGKALTSETWSRHASAALRSEGGTGFEQLNFPVRQGTYYLQVAVKDSATGRVVTDSAKFDAYASVPGASDLVVATDMRAVVIGDTASQPGEIARGNLRFISSPIPQIDVTRPNLAYMFEAYSKDSTSGEVQLALTTLTGALILQVPTQTLPIPADGRVFAGKLPLEGLPGGQYLLKATLTVQGKATQLEAEFSVAEPRAALARSVQVSAASRGIDEAFFRTQSEDSLDAMADELHVFPGITKRMLDPYKKDELSLKAKAQFLIDFWAPRDRNKSTPENEDRLAFYAAVDYANAHYSQRNVPGWKTDRGRIYAAFGPPDDSLPSNMAGQGVPYLVWRISRGKQRWFVLIDRTNQGNWQLVRSNEQSVGGMPGSLVEQLGGPGGNGVEAAEAIATWLGMDKMYFINNP